MEQPDVITRFVESLENGKWDELADWYTDDAIFDASVPNWHFQIQGADACVSQLKDWYGSLLEPKVTELNLVATAEGVVVDFEVRGTCPGDENHKPHLEGTRQAHIFRISDGRIAEQRVYCSGEWNEEDFRRIDAEAPKVTRPARV